MRADPLDGRKQVVRVCVLISAFVLAVSSTAGPAQVFKCDPSASYERRYQDSDLVFFGVAATFHRSSDSDLRPFGSSEDYWEFEVEGVWKGPSQDQLRVYLHAPNVWSDCDLPFEFFEQHQNYLVYADTDPGYPNRYRTGSCSGTVTASKARADISLLGNPKRRFRK